MGTQNCGFDWTETAATVAPAAKPIRKLFLTEHRCRLSVRRCVDIALWSVDSEDYGERDPGKIAERCSPPKVVDGDVLLFHEGQQWTLNALPRIVTALHSAGFECVTMHDLFAQ